MYDGSWLPRLGRQEGVRQDFSCCLEHDKEGAFSSALVHPSNIRVKGPTTQVPLHYHFCIREFIDKSHHGKQTKTYPTIESPQSFFGRRSRSTTRTGPHQR